MRKVPFVSIAAGLVAMAIVVVRAQVTTSATQREPQELVLSVVAIIDTYPTEYILTLNNTLGYKTVASLEKHIGDLLAGSTITWAPSDVRRGDEPLLSYKEQQDFAAFCEEKKVKVVIKPMK